MPYESAPAKDFVASLQANRAAQEKKKQEAQEAQAKARAQEKQEREDERAAEAKKTRKMPREEFKQLLIGKLRTK